MARRDVPAIVGGSILLAIVLMALFAPYVTPHDPNAQELRDRLLPPAWIGGGSTEHLLGTDRNGRDMLARIAFGARLTLLIGVTAVFVGGLVGVTAGALAGFLRGWVDLVIGRVADVQQAIPFVVLALAVVAVVGASLANLILVLGVGSWLFYFRIVRGEVLSVRQRPFIEAAVATGRRPRPPVHAPHPAQRPAVDRGRRDPLRAQRHRVHRRACRSSGWACRRPPQSGAG